MSAPNIFRLCGEDPAFVRSSLASFLRARRAALEIRAERRATATVAERVAMADVLAQVDRWVFDARAWLAERGLPCNEPAESAGGASMAQGCAAPSPAVGPAATEPARARDATPADPFSLCPGGQSLPAVAAAVDPQAALEAAIP